MTTKHTFCRICEAHCGLIVELNPDNTIAKIRPDKAHPISQGFVCAKGLKFGTIADHPERLLYPQKRNINGKLERIAWETAFSDICTQLKHSIAQHGKHAVAIYFGTPMIHNALGVLAVHQWAKAIGTRNVYSAGTQDNANKFPAQNLIHGSPWIMPIFDLEHAEFAVIIGANPALSQGTFVHMEGGTRAYDDFLARGGEFAIIDPRYSESAQRWGGHIPIRPLTDPFLLLSLLNECRDLYTSDMPAGLDTLLALAEKYPAEKASTLTGIPTEQIKTLAEKIRTQRTTFMLSIGVNQGAFGTLSMVVMQALAYLTGNFDVQGGLLFNRYARFIDYLVGLPEHENRITGIKASAGGMPCGALANEILTEGDGQIKALAKVDVKNHPFGATEGAQPTIITRRSFYLNGGCQQVLFRIEAHTSEFFP
ncbi:MAG: molybdopterin-dependent oxidoreductase, partial [Chloroflexota bacterium]